MSCARDGLDVPGGTTVPATPVQWLAGVAGVAGHRGDRRFVRPAAGPARRRTRRSPPEEPGGALGVYLFGSPRTHAYAAFRKVKR
ncbi:hypothetical protein [Streptomyces sp. NBC_01236]|uniref:hypothetical protein n=1 Tax=Streptomyces sp. NBC_01236 TaxID=2903789 RepID=UPI002E10C96F|nr:hypothetical protein OG324_38505 [Streptomyces sp. NBC_01236]